jgi:hypothetical protein
MLANSVVPIANPPAASASWINPGRTRLIDSGCRIDSTLMFLVCEVPEDTYGSQAPRLPCLWIIGRVDLDYITDYNGIMKTTVDIPDSELAEAMAFTKARTKREAIVTALMDFNRRRRMAALVKHAGTCSNLVGADEVRSLRRKG